MLLNKAISKTAGSVNCSNVVVLHKKTVHVRTINRRYKEVKAAWTASHVQDTVKKLQHRVTDVADFDHLADMTYYTWLEGNAHEERNMRLYVETTCQYPTVRL